MKKKKGGKKNIIIMLIVIVFFLFLFYLNFERNCGGSESCFNQAATVCKPARVQVEKEGNIFLYRVLGFKDGRCELNIKILKMSPDTSTDINSAFLGKDMTCRFELGQLKQEDATEIKDILSYCTGPLKEAMYEVMIQKLYGVIAQNMGGIIAEIQDTMPSV
jgi:hypothetical protein